MTLPPHWQSEFLERAAIMEYDGCMDRLTAERLAMEDTQSRMAKTKWSVALKLAQNKLDQQTLFTDERKPV